LLCVAHRKVCVVAVLGAKRIRFEMLRARLFFKSGFKILLQQ
jgi:hypothetical protein